VFVVQSGGGSSWKEFSDNIVYQMAAPWGLFPQPDSGILSVVPLVILGIGILMMLSELTGNQLQYSKFATGNDSTTRTLSGKTGMFLNYLPSGVAASVLVAYMLGVLPMLPSLLKSCGASGAASLIEQAVSNDSDNRLLLVALALSLLFDKRLLEVLFVQKFSGTTTANTVAFITNAYFLNTIILLYAQLWVTAQGFAAPTPNLKWPGLALFLVAITGNGYHHWLLANLRKGSNMGYMAPQGGLFGVFVCPHYVCEILSFVGIALISQTLVACSLAALVSFYLTSRSASTKKWYLKKIDGFPKERCVLIPGVW